MTVVLAIGAPVLVARWIGRQAAARRASLNAVRWTDAARWDR